MIAHFIFKNPLSARCRVYDERTCDLGRLFHSPVSLVFITSTPNNHDNFLETDYRAALSPAQQTGLPRVSFAEPVPNVTVAVGRDAALS
jgi:hypothetical protein